MAQLPIQSQQPPLASQPVDIFLQDLRRSLVIYIALALLALVAIIYILFTRPITTTPFLIGLIMIVGIIASIVTWRQVKQLEGIAKLREAALAGHSHLVADDQPTPNSQALGSVTSFTVDWSLYTAISVFISATIGFIILRSILEPNASLLDSLFAGLIIALLFALIVAFMVRPYFCQKITLTEDGIKVSLAGRQQQIRWDEVRLFAVYALPPAPLHLITSSKTTYELVGDDRIVRWHGHWTKTPLLRMQGTDDPNTLLHNLPDFVTSKTRQTLVDLDPHSASKGQTS